MDMLWGALPEWPPPPEVQPWMRDQLLRWAQRAMDGPHALSGGYIGNVISAAATVALRAGVDWRADPQIKDIRAKAARSRTRKPRRHAMPARRADVMRLWSIEPCGRGLLAAVLFFAAARCSDWARRGLDGAAPTPRRIRRTGARSWMVQYLATKSDPTGLTRLVEFSLPVDVASAFRRRIRATHTDRPVFDTNAESLRAWLKRVAPGLTAHSFRRGAVASALKQGVKGRHVMRLTGHRSLEALVRYAEELPVEWRKQMRSVAAALAK